MTNIQKCILLISATKRRSSDRLVVRDGKLYIASWDVNYHNGNHENYEEKRVTEKQAEGYLPGLEADYSKERWEAHVNGVKKSFLMSLYEFGIRPTPV